MAKRKKGKLPKEVLGVKVPKELRKAGEKLIEQAQGPAGRQAIAGALTAVVGAVASAALSKRASGTPDSEPPSAAPPSATPASARPASAAPPPAGPAPASPATTLAEIAAAVIDGVAKRRV